MKGTSFVGDFRKVDFKKISYNDLSPKSDSWQTLCENLGTSKIATLHATVINYAIGRQAGSLFTAGEVERQPFIDPHLAADWLGLPFDELEKNHNHTAYTRIS